MCYNGYSWCDRLFNFAFKLPPVCKQWPGLPSIGGAGIERGSTRVKGETLPLRHTEKSKERKVKLKGNRRGRTELEKINFHLNCVLCPVYSSLKLTFTSTSIIVAGRGGRRRWQKREAKARERMGGGKEGSRAEVN